MESYIAADFGGLVKGRRCQIVKKGVRMDYGMESVKRKQSCVDEEEFA